MKVILAGYNLDAEVIQGLKRGETQRDDITPEVLSASYARISRDPRPVHELRAEARSEVGKARKSNSAIIFKMGHHSVAEHAVFNFDILDISRLALEELEKFRLCSYTEKSQRYQKLEDSFVIPEEIGELRDLFVRTIEQQNAFYQEMVSKNIEPEDARYITPLATKAQLGMTLNARNLEHLFRRFASSPLREVQELGKELFDKVKDIAPSIILFTDANPLDKDTREEVKKASGGMRGGKKGRKAKELVRLELSSKDADRVTLATLLCSTSDLSFKECLKIAKKLPQEQKSALIKTALKNMEFYDPALREFELVDLTYDLVISAACFAQLKRHRMATLITQPYQPKLGVTIPPSVSQAGLEDKFKKLVSLTEKAFRKIEQDSPLAAQYILTNAHRRRAIFKCNARELYHLSRLREDKHAQWDIQNISRKMAELAKEKMPLTLLTIGGKDAYPEIFQSVFGSRPKALPLY